MKGTIKAETEARGWLGRLGLGDDPAFLAFPAITATAETVDQLSADMRKIVDDAGIVLAPGDTVRIEPGANLFVTAIFITWFCSGQGDDAKVGGPWAAFLDYAAREPAVHTAIDTVVRLDDGADDFARTRQYVQECFDMWRDG